MTEIEELRAEIAALRKEVADLRADRSIHHYHHVPSPLEYGNRPSLLPQPPLHPGHYLPHYPYVAQVYPTCFGQAVGNGTSNTNLAVQ